MQILLLIQDSTGTAVVGGVTYTLGVKDQTINTVYGFKKGKHELLPFPQQEIFLSGTAVGGTLGTESRLVDNFYRKG